MNIGVRLGRPGQALQRSLRSGHQPDGHIALQGAAGGSDQAQTAQETFELEVSEAETGRLQPRVRVSPSEGEERLRLELDPELTSLQGEALVPGVHAEGLARVAIVDPQQALTAWRDLQTCRGQGPAVWNQHRRVRESHHAVRPGPATSERDRLPFEQPAGQVTAGAFPPLLQFVDARREPLQPLLEGVHWYLYSRMRIQPVPLGRRWPRRRRGESRPSRPHDGSRHGRPARTRRLALPPMHSIAAVANPRAPEVMPAQPAIASRSVLPCANDAQARQRSASASVKAVTLSPVFQETEATATKRATKLRQPSATPKGPSAVVAMPSPTTAAAADRIAGSWYRPTAPHRAPNVPKTVALIVCPRPKLHMAATNCVTPPKAVKTGRASASWAPGSAHHPARIVPIAKVETANATRPRGIGSPLETVRCDSGASTFSADTALVTLPVSHDSVSPAVRHLAVVPVITTNRLGLGADSLHCSIGARHTCPMQTT